MKWSTLTKLLIVLGCALAWPQNALAHLGPPYPIMNDQPIPGYIVSVTSNPDVWSASAYVMLTAQSPSAQAVSSVNIWIQPVSRRVPRVNYAMVRESSTDPVEFDAKPDFDRAENWTVGVDIKLADGTVEHFITQTMATPPGIGPWGLLFFLIPFLIFGGLGAMVFVRRRKRRLAHARRGPTAKRVTTRAVASPEKNSLEQP